MRLPLGIIVGVNTTTKVKSSGAYILPRTLWLFNATDTLTGIERGVKGC